MKTPKPEPVVTSTACSLCGLDWDAHGDKPTALTCIELLRAAVVRRSALSLGASSATQAVVTWNDTGDNTLRTLRSVQRKPPDDPDMGVPAKVG